MDNFYVGFCSHGSKEARRAYCFPSFELWAGVIHEASFGRVLFKRVHDAVVVVIADDEPFGDGWMRIIRIVETISVGVFDDRGDFLFGNGSDGCVPDGCRRLLFLIRFLLGVVFILIFVFILLVIFAFLFVIRERDGAL